MTDDDRAIEQYRSQLTAEAELAHGDVDEIDDHLRSLIRELRETGMSNAEAITEACRRLGEPTQLAREHARVRTPFGAKLSRMRSWSAAALLVPPAIMSLRAVEDFGMISLFGFDFALAMIVVAGLIARVSWARPIILGSLATMFFWDSVVLLTGATISPFWLLPCFGGALAFVAPWRRGELSNAAIGLALLAPAYQAAIMAVMYLTGPNEPIRSNPLAVIAVVGLVAAGAGFLTRARWAALASAIAALALTGATFELLRLRDPSNWHNKLLLGTFAVGAVAAATSAVVGWRTARSNLGTVRGVLG